MSMRLTACVAALVPGHSNALSASLNVYDQGIRSQGVDL
jgi:hypothetical protein